MPDPRRQDDRRPKGVLDYFGLSPLRRHMQTHAAGILVVTGIVLLGLAVYLGLYWAARLR